jgi:hypothetical protein
MITTYFQVLDPATLSTATGGQTDGGGGGSTSNDFASRYVNNLKQDAKDWVNREQTTVDDLRAHNWGGAAKSFGGVLLDEVGAIGDAIVPFKAIK